MEYTLHLDAFEGPFDLLLHLININEIDIYDIPVNEVTNQYLEYLYKMSELDMEIASSFLVMASVLIELKSKMLLPWRKNDDDKFMSSDDPRTDLVIKLLAYKKYKQASAYLQEREQFGRSLAKPQGELEQFVLKYDNAILNSDLDRELLVQALARLNISANRMDKTRKEYFSTLKRDEYTVQNQIDIILSRINNNIDIKFDSLFDTASTKLEVIVTFLAILELLKQRKINVKQDKTFDTILINKSNRESENIGA